MTGKSINYYDSMSSPWTYLGHLRFEHLCRVSA
jgi:2-hydroxychromene-2-carboxylate isomerase